MADMRRIEMYIHTLHKQLSLVFEKIKQLSTSSN